MDWDRMPSLSALRAFAVLAEAGGVARAGEMLNVSHAAISQQVRGLENRLGTQLIRRDGRGTALTPEGVRLAKELRAGFQTIRTAVGALAEDDRARPLQVTMTPVFATSWLLPRLAAFRSAHPGIELMLNPTPQLVSLEPGGVDLAIRFGDGDWPGLESRLLLRTNFVLVAAPELIGGRPVTDPEALLDYPWLQELSTNEVSEWFRTQGVVDTRRVSMTHMPGHMVLEAVRRGEGISAVAEAFVADDIAAGRLQVLFGEVSTERGYYIVTRPGVMRPPVKAFVGWLRQTAGAELDSGQGGAIYRVPVSARNIPIGEKT